MLATDDGLNDLLFPSVVRRRVLSLLLLKPDASMHVREIARRVGSPAGTVVKELDRLQACGLLLRTRVGNQVHFAANPAHPVHGELAALLRKTVGLADVLRDALSPLASRIRVALVFGSMARGTAQAGSDVDVLVIGDIGFTEAALALDTARRELGREVNPKVYAPAEWAERRASGSAFAIDVMAQPKILLLGDPDDLARLPEEPAVDSPA